MISKNILKELFDIKAFYESRQYEITTKIWHKIIDDIRFVPHWHGEIEFIHVLKGSCTITIETETIKAKSGDLIIIDSGMIHSSNLDVQENQLEFLIFDTNILNNAFSKFNLKSALLTKELLIEKKLYTAFNQLLELIRKELNEKNVFFEEIISSAIKQFCLILKRNTADMVLQDNHLLNNDRISRIDEFQNLLDFIEHNYYKNIILEDGASLMNLSHSYFSTLFKEYTGSTFTKYLNAIRIENSIIEMKNTDHSITEIAYANGFNNVRTFNRCFKSLVGLTPSEFIKQSEEKQEKYIFNVRRSSQVERTDKSKNKTIFSNDSHHSIPY